MTYRLQIGHRSTISDLSMSSPQIGLIPLGSQGGAMGSQGMDPLWSWASRTRPRETFPGIPEVFPGFCSFLQVFPCFFNREIDFSIKKWTWESKKNVNFRKIQIFRYPKIDVRQLKWSRMIPGTKKLNLNKFNFSLKNRI